MNGPIESRQRAVAKRAEQIGDLLPGILRRTRSPARDDLLSALLAAMAELQWGREKVLDELDAFYDPERAPLDSLLFLAYWVDLEPLIAPGQPPGLAWIERDDLEAFVLKSFPTGLDRLRALVASSVPLVQQRGTPHGLQRFLETATGLNGFEVLESRAQPFHIRVVYPPKAQPNLAFIERLIEYQKPAYLTYELIEGQAESMRGQGYE